MNLEYPIQSIHENLALTKNNEVMAFYKMPYFSTTKGKDEVRLELKNKIGSVLRKLRPNGWFEIHLVSKDFLLKEKMNDMRHALSKETVFKRAGEQFLHETYVRLTKEMEIPFQYEWLIGIPLTKQKDDLEVKEVVRNAVDDLAQKTMNNLGYDIALDENWGEDWMIDELTLRQSLSGIEPSPLDEEELFYHLRLQFLPYIAHSQKEVCANRGITNVTDTMIYGNRMGRLHFVAEQGESYISILPIGKNMNLLNNNHIGEVVQSFNFPVDYVLKGEFMKEKGVNGLNSKRDSAKTRSRKINQESARTGNATYKRVALGVLGLEDLYQKMDEKEPIIEYSHFFVISASSKKQLRLRKQTVKNAFQNRHFEISPARMDTPYLFQSLLYGKKPDLTSRFWKHHSTARGIAENLFFTTSKAGGDKGMYIGRVDSSDGRWEDLSQALRGSRNIILYDCMLALEEEIKGKKTKNVHTLITGETGSGKTILGQDILWGAILENIKTLYVDPKRSLRKQWLEVANDPEWASQNPYYAAVIKSINWVTLDIKDKKNIGVLDPIVVLESDDAVITAKEMIDYLGKNKWGQRQQTAISKAVKAVVVERGEGNPVGMQHVIEKLRQSNEQDIKDAGEALYEMLDGSLLSLAFSDGQTAGLDYEAHATILEIADLRLPKKDKIEIDERERQSVALMMALGNFCQRFGERNENEDTIEFFDEAWVLMASSEGQNVVKSMRRVGRSQHNKLVLITQSVHDAQNEDDTTGFGELFTFYEKNEGKSILEHVGLEYNKRNLQWVSNMQSGQCLYLDVFGRLNRISVEIPENLLTLFSPEKWRKIKENRKMAA
jgi:hypothetical protein